jgi:hypothetical protein
MLSYTTALKNRARIGNEAEKLEIPRWKMLLPKEEMIKLIERGYKIQLQTQGTQPSVSPQRKMSKLP